MTTTVREELAKVASSCEDAIQGLSELEEVSNPDFQAIDQLIKQFEGSRGNRPATSEDVRSLAILVKKAIDGNKLNVQLTKILMILIFQVSLLAQQEPDMVVDAPANIDGAVGKWLDQWKAARESWDEYTD